MQLSQGTMVAGEAAVCHGMIITGYCLLGRNTRNGWIRTRRRRLMANCPHRKPKHKDERHSTKNVTELIPMLVD